MMKKQVTTLAAMLLASNVAVAGVSQMSADSIKSIVQAGKVLSAGTVKFSKGGVEVSKDAFDQTMKLGQQSAASTSAAGKKAVDSTVNAAQSTSTKASQSATSAKNAVVDSAQSAADGISNAAEFTVDQVRSAASKSGQVIELTATSLRDGAKWTMTFSYNTSTAVGRSMVNTASKLLNAGKTVVIATSNAGVVLVTDSANGVGAVLQGDIKAGSLTMIASASRSAQSFESNMVEGLQKK